MPVHRTWLRRALAALWLLDGALQLQPFMFTHGFVSHVLAPAAAGQPQPLHAAMLWADAVVAAHIAAFNTAFALAQIAIGTGLLFPRTVRAALLGSILWSANVWLLGEGAGGLLTASASPITGAPGAAALYLVASVMLWPTGVTRARAGMTWTALWVTGAALFLLPANHTATGSVGLLGAAAAAHPEIAAALLATASVAIGLAIHLRAAARAALLAGAALSIAYWLLGQSPGELTTGMATDPASGPVWILVAAAVALKTPNPARRPPRPGQLRPTQELVMAARSRTPIPARWTRSRAGRPVQAP